MRSKFVILLRLAFVLTLLTALLLPTGAVFAASTENKIPNNAAALVARGEDAFMRSTYDFSANWIWNPTDNGAGNRWMIFRKDVELSEVPERVTV